MQFPGERFHQAQRLRARTNDAFPFSRDIGQENGAARDGEPDAELQFALAPSKFQALREACPGLVGVLNRGQ